ncbi:hypothetical protein LshimejAT787_1200010 [Lyophyllum shimeji]|uniref:Uncharacterized protein n=1 Tax=Lyophyllum shimeji TaxID=47721 RepID=A0A9P3URT3_LYOSH|nr:hypothetical protein LshimejAT787_1200010 [Lyophyllum shimeji]
MVPRNFPDCLASAQPHTARGTGTQPAVREHSPRRVATPPPTASKVPKQLTHPPFPAGAPTVPVPTHHSPPPFRPPLPRCRSHAPEPAEYFTARGAIPTISQWFLPYLTQAATL